MKSPILFLVSALIFLTPLPGIVLAVDFADLPPGLDAQTIVQRQQERLFPDDRQGYDKGCLRGRPAPWFTRKIQSEKSHYYEAASATESLEAVVTTSGEALTIFNGGCEYYTVGIRYEFPAGALVPGKSPWWFGKAAKALLLSAALGADPVFDLKKCAAAITRAADGRKKITDIVEMPVEGDGFDFLQTRISITGYGRLSGHSGGFIEMELSKGPL